MPLSVAKLYLFAYNSLQALGWAIGLFRILGNLVSTNSLAGAYASSGELICFLQVAAFLEVVHGALGIVPSGVLFPLMQWGGRTHFVLAIVRKIDEVQRLPSVFVTLVAWSLSEVSRLAAALLSMLYWCYLLSQLLSIVGWFILLVACICLVIRYSQYALNCIESCPSWVTYLRYTAFIVLYPVGLFTGEMLLMYQALPYVKEKNLYANSFSALPFSYYNFLCAVLICYPFLWLNLYLHMFKQRRSKLGRRQDKNKKK